MENKAILQLEVVVEVEVEVGAWQQYCVFNGHLKTDIQLKDIL